MNRYPPLIFWGNERFSTCPDYNQTPILAALLAAGWPIQAVVIRQDSVVSRQPRRQNQQQLAEKWGFDLIAVDGKTPLGPAVSAYSARLGVLASFGRLIPGSVLDQFDGGIVNVHPSLLPAYRGPTPIETVIREGQTRTGISLIKTVPGIDAGPIYDQKSIEIELRVEKLDLTAKLGRLAAELIVDKLPEVASGQLEPKAQDEAQVSWTQPLKANDRDLDWRQPAIDLERLIRAQAGWPGSIAAISGQKLKVLAAKVVDSTKAGSPGRTLFDRQNQLLAVDCQPGRLGLTQVQLPGRQPVTAAEFYNGYGRKLGLATSST